MQAATEDDAPAQHGSWTLLVHDPRCYRATLLLVLHREVAVRWRCVRLDDAYGQHNADGAGATDQTSLAAVLPHLPFLPETGSAGWRHRPSGLLPSLTWCATRTLLTVTTLLEP